MPLFRREYKLIIGQPGEVGSEIQDLQINFKIVKSADAAKNKCTVKVFNMSPDTRALFETANTSTDELVKETNNPVILLQTQYAEDITNSGSLRGFQTLFTGQVVNAITSKIGGDMVTQIEAQDGYVPLREGLVGASKEPPNKNEGRNFPPGTTRRTVLNTLVGDLGVPVGEIRDGDDLSAVFSNGVTIEGPIRLALDSLLDPVNIDWSIQDDSFVAIRRDLASLESILDLSAQTGLIGSPQAKKARASRTTSQKNEPDSGVQIKSLLAPTMTPNRRIRVTSNEFPNGQIFKVTRVIHAGDFRGTNWISTAELSEFTE